MINLIITGGNSNPTTKTTTRYTTETTTTRRRTTTTDYTPGGDICSDPNFDAATILNGSPLGFKGSFSSNNEYCLF